MTAPPQQHAVIDVPVAVSKRLSPDRKDAYLNNLQTFIDDTARAIAARIAEKKALELDNTRLKIEVHKAKEDARKLEQLQRPLRRALDQELELKKKREKDTAELSEILRAMQEKLEARRAEVDARLADARAALSESRQSLAIDHTRLDQIKHQMKTSRHECQAEIKGLERAHVEATDAVEAMRKRLGRSRDKEREREKIIQQKSKLLESLVGKETMVGSKTAIHKEVAKILRSPRQSTCGTRRSSNAPKT